MTGRLILVRHGQSHGNVERRLDTRPPGADLTELGVQQAREFARARVRPPGLLLHSVARRAAQTAATIGSELGARSAVGEMPGTPDGLALREAEGIHEVQAGDLENRNDDDAIAEFNASYSPTPNKSKGRRLARSAINVPQQFVDVIHTCATDILALLAQVCLLNRTIAAHADEYGALPPIPLAPTSTQEEDVFHYLAGHSSSRNSFAVANFLRAEHIKLERMFAHCYELESGNEIVWLRELLSRKSIKWLMELNELTSKDSLA